ncbi:hypothetical protein I302_105911 [Kwoniella bestiolae CBS 10118]|uniref:Peptidase S9 prolyl oligopeptidase catalytic domain-containing protein n=1 Tax=Kwoniella bestiolae CBS 10118 TaxID=1296100 RepID=A0AAJ8KAN9_9TREE
MSSKQDEISVGKVWEAVGPFSSGMREHPLTGSPLSAFLDPSIHPDVDFALRPYKDDETWPSEIGNAGRVGWKKFKEGDDGWIEISYPEINWDQLRSDHGWASLQYHSILRTTLTVPQISDHQSTPFKIDVTQGVEYAFVPISLSSDSQAPIEWYAGDIYAFSETPTGQRDISSKTSNLARTISLFPGEYMMMVRAIYEIRMFGDPGQSTPPVIRLKIVAEVDQADEVEVIEGLGEVPDVVDGWFMGDWISVAVRVPDGAEDVEAIGVESSLESFVSLILLSPAQVKAGQTRPVSIRMVQFRSLLRSIKSLDVTLKVRIKGQIKEVTWHPRFNHSQQNDTERLPPFKITFPSSMGSGIPSAISHAIIIPPPLSQSQSHSHSQIDTMTSEDLSPVLLILHGAGVDITQPMMSDAVPSMTGYWTVLPTGRNEWGEDWHGGSMQDVWSAREAFGGIIHRIGNRVSDKTILMGHSNGGQGAWHLAARYPDRIVGMVAASGWLTIQDYVPYTELTSKHYADPALLGILSSSLSPYNNDLYLSNLVDIPILVIHGAEDDNVPPRHSRSYLSMLSSWAGEQDGGVVKYLEMPKKRHWWDDVIRSNDVVQFIKNLPSRKSWDGQRKKGFTLTTANPQESGGRAGIRIVELDIPGRIGRLDVNARQWRGDDPAKPLDLRGMNVKRIELISAHTGQKEVLTRSSKHGEWYTEADMAIAGPLTPPRANGPMIRFLSSAGPIVVVCSDIPTHQSIAKRISHDLYLYHRIDTEIMYDREALVRVARGDVGESNLVVLGRPEENLFANWMIRQEKIPIKFPTKGVMLVEDKVIYDRGAGLITLHPHPTSSKALSMLIAGNDVLGMELAARLFPIRTGVPIPDWAIVGPQARWKGAGGFSGAGFWNDDWKWSEGMSWMDR